MKDLVLDDQDQDIEDHFEEMRDVTNMEERMAALKALAFEHVRRKKPITIRIHPLDLEIMQLKASKLGIPYQTYINMLIHKDASQGI